MALVSGVGCNSSSKSADLALPHDFATPHDLASNDLQPDLLPQSGQCNGVPNTASAIVETKNNAGTPTGTGGAIVDGTYVMTNSVVYNGQTPSTSMFRRTLMKTGATMQEVIRIDTGLDFSTTSTYTTTSTNLTRTITCPTTDAGIGGGVFSFTADANGFTLYDLAAKKSYVYTKL
jgi:hypothetical protein